MIRTCPAFRLLLLVGALHAGVWCVAIARPIEVGAQDGAAAPVNDVDRRIGEVSAGLVNLRVQFAVFESRFQSLEAGQREMNALLWRFIEGIFGLFLIIVGGLLSVVWSLRRGWLSSAASQAEGA